MLIILILDAISHHVKGYHTDDYDLGLTFVMKHRPTGSRSFVIYLIQGNGVMTLLGWNVDLFEFSDCSVLATFLV